jgi:hypothetical protein
MVANKHNIQRGELQDININKSYNNICNSSCKYEHVFNDDDDGNMIDLKFNVVNDIFINAVPSHIQDYNMVVLNNIGFRFVNMVFFLSRSINKYNGEEQTGEIIIILENDVKDSELFITIPITINENDYSVNSLMETSNKSKVTNNNILTPINTESEYNTPTIQTETLASLYNDLSDNKNKQIIVNKFKIGNLIPGNVPYFFRTEEYEINDIGKTVYYISYDVKNAIQISNTLYEIGRELTPRITDENGNTSIPEVENFILNFKRRFIVKNKLYTNPTIDTGELINMKCKPISSHFYNKTSQLYDIKDVNKRLIKYWTIIIICFLLLSYGLYRYF